MKRCFYQIFRPDKGFNAKGWGDCSLCQHDIKNKECRGYSPTYIKIVNVKKKEEKNGKV